MHSLWQQEAEALLINMIDSCYAIKHFINSDPCGFSFYNAAATALCCLSAHSPFHTVTRCLSSVLQAADYCALFASLRSGKITILSLKYPLMVYLWCS